MYVKKFQRKKEDFVCGNCNAKILGNGYTNHCSQCLYSRHCDINPGDRAENCGGMMKPLSVETKNGKHSIVQACLKCGFTRKNKVSKNDNFETIINLCLEE